MTRIPKTIRLSDGRKVRLKQPPANLDDLTGRNFGDLVVLGYADHEKAGIGWYHFWVCRCACGHLWRVRTGALQQHQAERCLKCARNRFVQSARIHGQIGTKEYRYWSYMKRRWGSDVCPRWRKSFVDFISDVGPRPNLPRLGVERIDPDGLFGPGNCLWTPCSQGRRGRLFTLDGKTQNMAGWARDLGISREAVRLRLLKHRPEVALSAPSTPGRGL